MSGIAQLSTTVKGALTWLASRTGVEPTLVQTHISWVILVGPFAYKLKKPVDFGFLDFSTPEKRLAACEREVELNRRLCPWVYLGVIPIVEHDGQVMLGRDGHVVDHAVWMRRLPEDRMLNRLLETGQATAQMVVAVADRLAVFHASAATSPAIEERGRLATVRANAEENFRQTRAFVGRTIDESTWIEIADKTRAFLASNESLFEQRVAAGRIRDGHGDLHAASICMTDPIAIFDCIEFDDRFRQGDVAAEVAFLAMDLTFYGRDDLARIFVDRYVLATRDESLRDVLDYYLSYRAFVRGKVESLRSNEPEIAPVERAEAAGRARRYFRLAKQFADRLSDGPRQTAGRGIAPNPAVTMQLRPNAHATVAQPARPGDTEWPMDRSRLSSTSRGGKSRI